MRLLVFLHGTVLMHSDAIGVTRAERVAQVRAGHPTVDDYAAYVPVDGAVAKSYGDVAGREAPDVLIEDDCESIGASQITYPQIPPDLRARIKSIIIPEFGGLDHLPDNPQALLTFEP